MTQHAETVFESAHLRADLFRSRGEDRSDWVVVTFSELFNRDLEGPGFGTQFLLGEGFDVLAVKNDLDDWYLGFGESELAAMREALAPYGQRASYGSSMGAFAAIKYAKALGIERALAISPILDFRYDWDTRHKPYVSLAEDTVEAAVGELLVPADISTETTYHLAFDPYCSRDVDHVRIVCEMAPRHCLLEVPFAGHPAGPTMLDSGILKAFALEAIGSNDTSQLRARTERTGRTLHNMAHYLFDRNKPRSALVANTRALLLTPEWGEVHILQARILHRLGRGAMAVPFGIRAGELRPDNPHIAAIVANILMDRGDELQARELVQAAITRIGPHETLVGVLRDLGDEPPG